MTDTFQWERCDATGSTCVDIGGATAATYLLAAGDVGHEIRCRGTRSGVLVGESNALGPVASTPVTSIKYGLFGSFGSMPLDPANAGSAYQAGVRMLVYELTWDAIEPSNGSFNSLAGAASTINQWKAWGYDVVLSYGIHHAPAWWFALDPNYTRFVDQHLTTFTTGISGADGQDPPNFINFDHTVGGMKLGGTAGTNDGYVGRYVKHVMDYFAANLSGGVNAIFAIRVGGGHFGELGYPNHYAENNYWIHDTGSRARILSEQGLTIWNGASGWKPGNSSPSGEAGKYMAYFRNRLNDFQNYQCALPRASGYTGLTAVLYPSFGATNAAVATAVSNNLNDSTSPEINGEVQRGYHHQYLVSTLSDANPLVWCTDVSGWSGAASSNLAADADLRGFAKGGENAGGSTGESLASMQFCVSQAKAKGYATFCWIRASDLAAGFDGVHLSDYKALIA